jgi:hypothetical protein
MNDSCCTKLKNDLNYPDKDRCFSLKTTAKVNAKTFRIENNSNKSICRVEVDGCLIDSIDVLKCDYMFKICETNEYFLVELKGTDVTHAVKQIVSTYDIIRRQLLLSANNFKGFIVSSSVPRAAEQRFRQLKEKTFKEKKLLIKKVHNDEKVVV